MLINFRKSLGNLTMKKLGGAQYQHTMIPRYWSVEKVILKRPHEEYPDDWHDEIAKVRAAYDILKDLPR